MTDAYFPELLAVVDGADFPVEVEPEHDVRVWRDRDGWVDYWHLTWIDGALCIEDPDPDARYRICHLVPVDEHEVEQ